MINKSHMTIKTAHLFYSISLLTSIFFPAFGWTRGWSCFFWDLQGKGKQIHLFVFVYSISNTQNGNQRHTVSFCISAVLHLASRPSIPNYCLWSLTSRSVPCPESKKKCWSSTNPSTLCKDTWYIQLHCFYKTILL